jgi:hypothetical protein
MNTTKALILGLLLLPGCGKVQPPTRFGFSHLSFTSYSWYVYDDSEHHRSQWHLTIHAHIQVDSSGAYQSARRTSWSDTLQYFKGVLANAADSVLAPLDGITSDSNYVQENLMPELYHGPTYFLIVRRGTLKPAVMRCNAILSPKEFKPALRLLRTLAQNQGGTRSEAFDLKPPIDVISRYDALWSFKLPDSLLRAPYFVTD